MWDGMRTVFFNCNVKTIDQASDLIIKLDDGYLTENKFDFRPGKTIGFSIGFTNDAHSGVGRHLMEVYGIISGSGDSFQDISADGQCSPRELPQ